MSQRLNVPPDIEPTPAEAVQSVTPTGRPVPERITTVDAARGLFKKLEESDKNDALRRARLKGQIDGNPPYDTDRLRELGLGNMTNVNFLEMRSALDAKASAWYELFFEVPRLIEVTYTGTVDTRQPTTDYGSIVAEEFTNAVFAWGGFLPNMDRCRRESDAYGIGVALFPDIHDWRFKAYARGSFLPDPNACVDYEELGVFALRDTIPLQKLVTVATLEPDIAESEGWDQSTVRRALVSLYVGPTAQTANPHAVSDWESWQQRIRNNDSRVQIASIDTVKVVHLFVMEADGASLSHYIFLSESTLQPDAFLFRKKSEYAKVTQALWLLPFNNGDGYLRSCRGVASLLEAHCDLSNRFLGRVFDSGFLSAGVMVQPKTAMDLSKIQLIRSGPLTVIPDNVNAIQSTTFAPPINNLVQLRDLSSSIMKNNSGTFRQYPEAFVADQPQKTAYEVAQGISREARVEKANAAYDYEQLDKLYREMFRRMTNQEYLELASDWPGKDGAKRFVEACIKRGVPRELLLDSNAWRVTATRAIGMGSWGVKLDITSQVLNSRGLLDEVGQVNALREWLAVRVGYRNVDKFKSLVNRDKIPTNETSIAALENNDFSEGKQVPVGSDQLHAMHFILHSEPIMQIVQAVEQDKGNAAFDVARAATFLQAALPHAMEHLQYLQGDPQREQAVEQGIRVLRMAASAFKMLQTLLAKQQALEAKLQQQNTAVLQDAQSRKDELEAQVELLRIQKDGEIERMKQESLNAMRAAKTQQQMQISRDKADAQIALAARQQQAELEMAAAKANGMSRMSEARVRPPGTP